MQPRTQPILILQAQFSKQLLLFVVRIKQHQAVARWLEVSRVQTQLDAEIKVWLQACSFILRWRQIICRRENPARQRFVLAIVESEFQFWECLRVRRTVTQQSVENDLVFVRGVGLQF